jgi:hypothetical protein
MMTRNACARIAGFAFLFYIVVGISGMAMGTRGGTAATLFGIGAQASAVVLAITLYAVTRGAGPTIALIGMICRLVEGLGSPLLKLVTGGTWSVNSAGLIFAVGSLMFSWLFLRGRMIPRPLAWLGVIASALLVSVLPLQLAGVFAGAANWSSGVTWTVWMPMLVFELTVAPWLIVKGVAAGVRDYTVAPS